MKAEKGWSHYFTLLTWFGFLPISINNSGTLISSASNQNVYYRMFIVMKLIVITLFIYGQIQFWKSANYGSTGQYFEFLDQTCCGLITLTVYLWMFHSKKHNFNTVRGIFVLHSRTFYIRDPNEKNHTLRNLKILAFLASFHWINCSVISAEHYNFRADFFLRIRSVIMIQYELNFTQGAVILSFYTALVWKVKAILQRINSRLLEIVRTEKLFRFESGFEIIHLLNYRNDALQLCVSDLSVIYGFVILIISVAVLNDLIHNTFYFFWRFEQKNALGVFPLFYTLRSSFLWLAPSTTIFVLAFTCNDIGKEVSFVSMIAPKSRLFGVAPKYILC